MNTDTLLLKKILASTNEIKAELASMNGKIDSLYKKTEPK